MFIHRKRKFLIKPKPISVFWLKICKVFSCTSTCHNRARRSTDFKKLIKKGRVHKEHWSVLFNHIKANL
ncbi:hypothetical protein EUGRSUZ_A02401 [Eucalyptus grandis]|uniref:Uncharacterized protein n=2 Tax=Eucalyptus grandis TaxID=71139 RepID=A0ACC3M7H8_EUCGR|nr:hypothetical protein EUGRSUZ_A02401 [Eucalyptus grandis]